MSEQTTPPRGRLREHVAEEIRVLLARRKMSGTELARRTGITQSTMSRRMTGEKAFDMDDLEAIASVLNIEVGDLFPRQDGRSSQDFDHAPRESAATIGHLSVRLPARVLSPDRTSRRRRTPRPFSQPKPGAKPGTDRPVSAVPARKRRPQPVRPGHRPERPRG